MTQETAPLSTPEIAAVPATRTPTARRPLRQRAELSGDFVVFLIGMRINRPLRVRSWLPVVQAMPQMIRELEAHPELGLLGTRFAGLTLIQYWRSQEHLLAYARSRDSVHLPAWQAFNRRAKDSAGDVGIWHETYMVRAGEYENVYVDVPAMGLGRAGTLVNASGSR
ncbi:DUF4188 domain-containing protein [Deinococcus ruber]|uniref:Transcriptional regulator n=1 Tax=Deinococcus ruber TaxID=1848197 RepID=A0A918C1F7_9DEIO|nr:DUF4188 domain-containing protein [Deinococcus ruber]GGR02060.1 transcriptional regulator [Deinococcus ruber]